MGIFTQNPDMSEILLTTKSLGEKTIFQGCLMGLLFCDTVFKHDISALGSHLTVLCCNANKP